ncbi:hypothetical protein, partial [Neisseria sicca]|uniref:hypothetical protein n=1 Tax=Neisseria sicca TaxID=490 RepID=UPI001C9A2264
LGVDDVGGCGWGGDAGVFDQRDVAGVVGGEVEVVEDHEEGDGLLGEGGKVLHEGVLIAEVEMVGRVMKKEDLGILEQGGDEGGGLV